MRETERKNNKVKSQQSYSKREREREFVAQDFIIIKKTWELNLPTNKAQ